MGKCVIQAAGCSGWHKAQKTKNDQKKGAASIQKAPRGLQGKKKKRDEKGEKR